MSWNVRIVRANDGEVHWEGPINEIPCEILNHELLFYYYEDKPEIKEDD